jgi:hypothetical protein
MATSSGACLTTHRGCQLQRPCIATAVVAVPKQRRDVHTHTVSHSVQCTSSSMQCMQPTHPPAHKRCTSSMHVPDVVDNGHNPTLRCRPYARAVCGTLYWLRVATHARRKNTHSHRRRGRRPNPYPPSASFACTSAPCERSISATATSPREAAQWSGVHLKCTEHGKIQAKRAATRTAVRC